MRTLLTLAVLLGARVALAGCASGAGSLAAPPTVAPPPALAAAVEDPAPVEPDAPNVVARTGTRPSWVLVSAGLGVGGSAFLWSAIGAAASGDGFLAIPIAGPIVEATRTNRGAATIALLSIDAAAQLGGLAVAIAGGAKRQRVGAR